jgi:hypothetical protein
MPSGSSIRISVKPQGSIGRWLPEDRDSGRGQPDVLGVDIRTWIQIITVECPAEPTARPDTSSSPGPRKNTTPGSAGAELPVDGQAQASR